MPIEKVYLPKEQRTVLNTDGTIKDVKEVTPWEVRASGKEVQELRGMFKDTAPAMMHETWKEWKSIGKTVITRPNGAAPIEIRADKEAHYRGYPGFCKTRVRAGVTISGFGGMKASGLTRSKILYKDGERIVLEER